MTDEEMTNNGSATAVLEPPDVDGAVAPPQDERAEQRRASGDDDLEYEVEFATPFGNLEFDFEPQSKQEKRAAERKAAAERAAAKKAREKARELARRKPKSRGVASNLLIALLVIAIVGAAIIIAYWLFARPGEEDDEVPAEFANEPQPAPQGLVARVRGRVSAAIRAGRKASRDAQREEREKFERLTGAQSSD